MQYLGEKHDHPNSESYRLGRTTYSEVADDNSATIDAFFLVLIYILALVIPYAFNGAFSWIMIVLLIPLMLLEWFMSTGVTFFVACRLFKGEDNLIGFFRAMGFSLAAGILNVLTVIPNDWFGDQWACGVIDVHCQYRCHPLGA